MGTWSLYLAVGVAGFFGAISRYALASLCGRLMGGAFPYGTFIVNVSGCFFLGWFLTYASARAGISDVMRLAVSVGFTGAYTTFSTFAFESNALLVHGAQIKALANLVGSVALGLLAVKLGIALAERM